MYCLVLLATGCANCIVTVSLLVSACIALCCSYDAWISDVEIEQDPEIPPLPEGAWHVHARWLLDLEEFNEWLNEEDYLFVPEQPVSKCVKKLFNRLMTDELTEK